MHAHSRLGDQLKTVNTSMNANDPAEKIKQRNSALDLDSHYLKSTHNTKERVARRYA
jgi:hypothetical protein